MERVASARAQASAELVAIAPLLLLATLVLGQVVAVGWALVTAGEAARAGARAAHVGGPARAAALGALPDGLGPAEIHVDGAAVRVRVEAPRVVPGSPAIPVAASAALDPAAGER